MPNVPEVMRLNIAREIKFYLAFMGDCANLLKKKKHGSDIFYCASRKKGEGWAEQAWNLPTVQCQ